MRKHGRRFTALLLALALAASALCAVCFSDTAYAAEAQDLEWWNFRNSQENNGITDRPTPTGTADTWQKWAAKYGTGWSASPTPPLILDGKLYVGMSNVILELDKETGEELRRSDPMPANVGYAMNPPIYADGKIFVQIGNGMVSAIDYGTLQVSWTTPKIGGQTVSPISYVKIGGTGYLYTGTWGGESGDGTFFCVTTDDSNVTDGVKELTWRFKPSGNPDSEAVSALTASPLTSDPALADDVYKARGFYWAGAYANENYIAIGSDNGAAEADSPAEAVFYTLDPLTGEIIDRITGVKGDIRSTAVFANGAVYFNTREGVLYKAPVSADGHFGTPATLVLGSMSTASPVVYGDKIYMGVCGTSQFSPDSGHHFAVIRDEGDTLTSLYDLPIRGYPQAAALVSTAHVGDDFDGDGEPDGRVYIYFTYNNPPGGVYCVYDEPDWDSQEEVDADQGEIFIPSPDKRQYCISTICADREGTMYYKNDSCYLFALESNQAALAGLSVKDGTGAEVRWETAFDLMTSESWATVAGTVQTVTVTPVLTEGSTAKVAGQTCTGSVSVALTGEQTDIPVVVEKAGQSRTYVVTVLKESSNPNLAALGSTVNNIPANNIRAIMPDFDPEITEYVFDWLPTGSEASTAPEKNAMMNLWIGLQSEKSSVKVYPGENVDPRNVTADGSITFYQATSNRFGYTLRVPVYSADTSRDSTAEIVVTAEDGTTMKTYSVTFERQIHAASVAIDGGDFTLQIGESRTLTAQITPEETDDKGMSWATSDETVASVDEDGTVTAVAPGRAEITVTTDDRGCTDTVTVTVEPSAETKEAIAQALAELEAFADPADYAEEDRAALQEAMDAGREAISAARTPEEAAEALQNAKEAIEAIPTAAEREAELQQAKDRALEELENYPDMNDYDAAGKQAVTEAVEAGKAAINAAATTEEAENALAEAIAAIDAVDKDLIAAFVVRLYDVCLNRMPDEAGLESWVRQLRSGSITGIKAAQGFIFSQEFKNKNFCNRHYVQALYQALMGREPDEGGWNDWIHRLETGSTREEVFNGFALSNEFTLLCNSYGITRGNRIGTGQFGTVPTGPCSVCGEQDGVTAFVERLYRICLGREADEGGLADWTNQLWNHTNTGKGVARGFVFSAEFTNMNLSNEAFVEAMYAAFFDREPDAGGFANWVSLLNGGTSRLDVFNGFADSREFANLCLRYGTRAT